MHNPYQDSRGYWELPQLHAVQGKVLSVEYRRCWLLAVPCLLQDGRSRLYCSGYRHATAGAISLAHSVHAGTSFNTNGEDYFVGRGALQFSRFLLYAWYRQWTWTAKTSFDKIQDKRFRNRSLRHEREICSGRNAMFITVFIAKRIAALHHRFCQALNTLP